jgi:hypothetical protein
MDLLRLWRLSDPEALGAVSLTSFLQQLRGKRPNSPIPGPSHYRPNVTSVRRAVYHWSFYAHYD